MPKIKVEAKRRKGGVQDFEFKSNREYRPVARLGALFQWWHRAREGGGIRHALESTLQGRKAMGFDRKATWGVWPGLSGHPDLILPLLTGSKFCSKRSIKYLIDGFYGRLQEKDGGVFVPWRAKVFFHFWKTISALQKKSLSSHHSVLFPWVSPLIHLHHHPDLPLTAPPCRQLSPILLIRILLPNKSLAKAPNLLIVKLEPPLSHVCVCLHVCVDVSIKNGRQWWPLHCMHFISKW